jgi:hypothetical protein
MDMVSPSDMVDWTDTDAVVGGNLENHFRCSAASTICDGSSEVLRSVIWRRRQGEE